MIDRQAEPSAAPPRLDIPPARRLVKALFGPYLRFWHQLRLEDGFNVPPHGPAIVVTNHASLLDVPVLMYLDPFPNTAIVVKASLFRMPVVKWLLHQWGAIPVERQGRDSGGVRQIFAVLRNGGVITVAAEGRRTRNGRLEPINPVLARIAVSANVPIIPLGIRGSYEALPPGALFPRRRPIAVRVGKAFVFERSTKAEQAAERIRQEIAALLPTSMRPLEVPEVPDSAA